MSQQGNKITSLIKNKIKSLEKETSIQEEEQSQVSSILVQR